MAEVIGVVSGIVQFIDVAVRLSSCLSRICSDIRNVPERFLQLRIDLDGQLEVAQEVQAHHRLTLVPMVASLTFDRSLLEYIVLAEELRKTLEELLDSNTNGRFKRNWHRIRSVRRKEQIFHLCDCLDRKKSTLSLWLGAANLRLSSNVAFTTDRTQTKVEEILAHVTPIEESLNRHVTNTELIIPHFQQTSHNTADSLEKLDRVIGEFQQTKDQSAMLVQQTGTAISRLDHINQISAQVSSDTTQILHSLQKLCSSFSQGGISTEIGHSGAGNTAVGFHRLPLELQNTVQNHMSSESTFNIKNLSPQELQAGNSITSDATSLSTEDINASFMLPNARDLDLSQREPHIVLTKTYFHETESKINTEHSSRKVCKCRVVNKAFHRQLLPFLHFKQIVQTQHFSYCPKYVQSDRTTEVMIQLVFPSWLLSRTVQFGLQLKYLWSQGTHSISPMVIGTSRFVDSDLSPAFLAIRNAKEKLLEAEWYGSNICITNLKEALEDLFDNGTASPFDTDCNGNNLLYEVLRVYIRHLIWGVPGYEYILLIQLLLDKGSDPNVISYPRGPKYWDGADDIGGTAFDLFAKQLLVSSWSMERWKATDPITMTILENLTAAGSEFSKPLNIEDCTHEHYQPLRFESEIRTYTFFEEQIEFCDLGGLVATILQRDESKFQKTMTKVRASDVNHVSSINGLAPIHFAVIWPKALKTLIARGVNINVHDRYHRRPIHLAVALGLSSSVDYLLAADCALYTPPDHRSLLQNALMLNTVERRHILDALIAALSDRHQRLIYKAQSCLSSSTFLEFDIIEDQKEESKAPWIRQELLSQGYTVPEALKLDDKSVYDVSDMHGAMQMTHDIADSLWSAGFREIDGFNHYGLTPLLQNWFCANFPMIAWFVEKNVSLSSRHRDASLNGLHLYAARIGYPGSNFSGDPEQVPTDEYHMAQIQREVGIPHDECTCPCSPHGCSPIKFLFDWRPQSSPKKCFRTWLEKVRPELRLSQQYVIEFTRCLLFDYLGGEHTCCALGQECGIEESTYGRFSSRDSAYENDGLPPPHDLVTSTEGAEMVKRQLDFYMSKYDEMPRPETMPLAEQPFHFLDWIMERYEEEEEEEESKRSERSERSDESDEFVECEEFEET